jgi:hypothetical protein
MKSGILLIVSSWILISHLFQERRTLWQIPWLSQASNFRVPLPPKLKYEVEVKYRPSIPDNVKHWKVFEDDLEIKIFLETVDEFSDLHIDQDQDTEEIPHADIFLNKIVDHHIVQLPSNHIPKGLVPLEILFDRNDVVVKVKGSTERC